MKIIWFSRYHQKIFSFQILIKYLNCFYQYWNNGFLVHSQLLKKQEQLAAAELLLFFDWFFRCPPTACHTKCRNISGFSVACQQPVTWSTGIISDLLSCQSTLATTFVLYILYYFFSELSMKDWLHWNKFRSVIHASAVYKQHAKGIPFRNSGAFGAIKKSSQQKPWGLDLFNLIQGWTPYWCLANDLFWDSFREPSYRLVPFRKLLETPMKL